MEEFDVVVIGAGPGGYVFAIRAAQLGLRAAIIEKEWLGGVCLNVGCIPTKALLRNAEVASLLRDKGREFGFSFDNLTLDYTAAVKRSRQVSDRLTRGVGFLMKKNQIDVRMGSARLTSAHEVEITAADGTVSAVQAKNIVIATGSHPSAMPGVELDAERIITYREAILQTSLPKSVVIIGAGAIGVEFATVWSSYGVRVTMVEMLPHILPLEDEEVALELQKAFRKKGIQALTDTRVLSVQKNDTGVTVRVSGPDGEQTLEADQALVAIGFKPNTSGIGLETAGVKRSPRGFVEVNDRMASSVPGIWAIGDVTGKLLLAHMASSQGILCAEAMAGLPTEPIVTHLVPRATYSQPQVASVGLTEAQAKDQGYEIQIGKFPFMANGKALGLGENAGFCKIIADAKTKKLLGAHLIGADVSELLPEVTLAGRLGLTPADIAGTIHAHPTLSEAIMEAALAVDGQSIQM
jgi:dihydrolipoamide dehydrogenase